MDIYEEPQVLSEYLNFHYGTETQLLPYDFGPKSALNFPVRCVSHLIAGDTASTGDQIYELAYDLGCAVGRSTFELGRHARKVKGFDLSNAFIGAARTLLDHGKLNTDIAVEGAITERIDIRAPAIAAHTDIGFDVGDAVELARRLPPADIVLAANLLCRLPNPENFLISMARLIKPGGQLLLVTPFTWLEAFTPRSAWPHNQAGDPIPGAVWIDNILGRDFVLEHAEDMPFLIREHARKFQWTVSFGMRWRRRD